MYTELAEIPVPTCAQFTTNNDGIEGAIVIRVSYSVKDHTAKHKRTMSKSLLFFPPDDIPKPVLPTVGSGLEDTSQIMMQAISPSKRKKALLRKSSETTSSGVKKYVEIWAQGLLEFSLDVSGFHGDFYTDEYFGSLEFSLDELGLIYVAESTTDPNDGTESDDPRQAYHFKPDFGEGFTGKRNPTIFFLSYSAHSDPPRLYQVIPANLAVHFGQPIFDPQTPAVIYATGYELAQGGRRLGIKGCFNRPSGIWRLALPDFTSTGIRDDSKDANPSVLSPMSVQKLTPPNLSCRSPRVLKTDLRATLVWLACASGGAHVSTSTLHCLDISSATVGDISEEALLASDEPLVGIPSQPLEDLTGFPGLYPAYNLPASPFIYGGDRSQTNLVLHSQWGSRTTILQISLNDGSIRESGPDDANSSLFSWSVLATNGQDHVVCSRSAPNVPYQIWLGRVRKHGGDLDWFLLDEPILPNHVKAALASIKTRIVSLEKNSLVEAIVIHKDESENIGIPACVTIPHGGPHASSTTAFTPSITALVLEGYTVSLPNYTGTPGYGEVFLQDLIGRCGELDVSDCIATARRLISLGISEDGPGKQFIVGGSHGGFLTAHLIAKFPDFFSAAVLRNPVISVGEISTSDLPDWYFSEFGLNYPLLSSNRSKSTTPSTSTNSTVSLLSPLMDPSFFSKLNSMSPISHLDQIQIPVLIMIGSADRRVAPSQGIDFYHALRARRATENREKSVEMLLFEGEGHPLDGVKAAKVLFEATRDWLSWKDVARGM